MAKIFSADLHCNENASIEFGAAIVGAVQNVRQSIAILANSRKADEYAPGAIHALRKLCAGEGKSSHIHRLEVEEWHETFLAWFSRVKRWFPKELVEEFRANAEADFRILLKCASDTPESFWRKDVSARHIQISFPSDAALKAAREAADQKHPVKLGSALHKYLEVCVSQLIDEESREPSSTPASTIESNDLSLRLAIDDKKIASLNIDQFHCFDRPADLEQDIVVTAYDVEDALKGYLTDNAPDVLKAVQFDCESSLFVVRSSDRLVIANVIAGLLELVSDQDLFATYRERS